MQAGESEEFLKKAIEVRQRSRQYQPQSNFSRAPNPHFYFIQSILPLQI